MSLVIYLFLVFVILMALYLLYALISSLSYFKDKSSSFESGFHSLGKLQKSYTLQFFSIMLVFIIFDVELVLLMGLLVSMKLTLSILLVLFFVIVGLWLEWYMGKLIWLI